MTIDRAKLKDLFVAMSDRTGRDIDPVTFKIYCDYFDEEELSTETVVDGMTHLVATWEKYWWPSADIIAAVSRRLWADKNLTPGNVATGEPAEREDRSVRIRIAKEWADANPDKAKQLRAKYRKEYRDRVATGGRLSGFYTTARDEALLSAYVNRALGRKEIDEQPLADVADAVAV